jgi:thioesterase domain-containing protein
MVVSCTEIVLDGRPVTLIGFSLGARVVFACLEELAKRGDTGGIVERVVLLGAPLVLNTHQWQTVRKVPFSNSL